MNCRGALIGNWELIASNVIVCLFDGEEVLPHKRVKEAYLVATFDKCDELEGQEEVIWYITTSHKRQSCHGSVLTFVHCNICRM